MKSMVLKSPGSPREAVDLPIPALGLGQVLVKISACGVSRVDLHAVASHQGRVARTRLNFSIWPQTSH